MVRLILFDIDGTLIRTHGAGVAAFGRVFASEFGIQDAAVGVSFAGRTDPSIVREVFARHGIEASEVNFARFFSLYPHWLDHLLSRSRGEICAGVWNLIHRVGQIAPSVRMGLLTGNTRLGAEIKLRHFQLWQAFQVGAFGDDHEDRNALARLALQRVSEWMGTDLNGEDVVVVGDTAHDIECARAIRARSLAVATGGNTLEDLRPHSPTWAVPNLNCVTAEEICGLAPAEDFFGADP